LVVVVLVVQAPAPVHIWVVVVVVVDPSAFVVVLLFVFFLGGSEPGVPAGTHATVPALDVITPSPVEQGGFFIAPVSVGGASEFVQGVP
jgi:hypothetical protein